MITCFDIVKSGRLVAAGITQYNIEKKSVSVEQQAKVAIKRVANSVTRQRANNSHYCMCGAARNFSALCTLRHTHTGHMCLAWPGWH